MSRTPINLSDETDLIATNDCGNLRIYDKANRAYMCFQGSEGKFDLTGHIRGEGFSSTLNLGLYEQKVKKCFAPYEALVNAVKKAKIAEITANNLLFSLDKFFIKEEESSPVGTVIQIAGSAVSLDEIKADLAAAIAKGYNHNPAFTVHTVRGLIEEIDRLNAEKEAK